MTAFATTSFMLGMYNAHLLSAGGAAIVIPVAFFFGGMVQIIVAILEVARGNVFGAVVFGTYGPFWVIYGFIAQHYAGVLAPASVASALALFLRCLRYSRSTSSLRRSRLTSSLMFVFALIFIGLVSAGHRLLVQVTSWWNEAGGWVTLAFAVLAWYHAAGDVIAHTFGRTVLPMGKVK